MYKLKRIVMYYMIHVALWYKHSWLRTFLRKWCINPIIIITIIIIIINIIIIIIIIMLVTA